eukprot:Clim_evm1s149 gene=Clim_evmTU1s149
MSTTAAINPGTQGPPSLEGETAAELRRSIATVVPARMNDAASAQAALKSLSAADARVRESLKRTLDQRLDLTSMQQSLKVSGAKLQEETKPAMQEICESVIQSASLAETINSKIKELDIAQERLSLVMRRVENILTLLDTATKIEPALEADDLEAATHFLSIYLKMPVEVLRDPEIMRPLGPGGLRSAKDVFEGCHKKIEATLRTRMANAVALMAGSGPGGTVPPQQKEAAPGGPADVNSSMQEPPAMDAVRARNGALQLFKQFPRLNLHNEGIRVFAEGLQKQYKAEADSQWLQGVTTPARQTVKGNTMVHLVSLTRCLDGLARLVDEYQSAVETYYGASYGVEFLKVLQSGGDDVISKLISHFRETKDLDSRQKRIGGARETDTQQRGVVSPGRGDNRQDANERQQVQLHELDMLLEEIVRMSQRADLYWSFVRRRLMSSFLNTQTLPVDSNPTGLQRLASITSADGRSQSITDGRSLSRLSTSVGAAAFLNDAENDDEESETRRKKQLQTQRDNYEQAIMDIMQNSGTESVMLELRINYAVLEEQFLRDSVARAVRLGRLDRDSMCTSLPDDVFFLFSKCCRRALNSTYIEGFCALVNICGSILQDALQPRLEGALRKDALGGDNQLRQMLRKGIKLAQPLGATLEKGREQLSKVGIGATGGDGKDGKGIGKNNGPVSDEDLLQNLSAAELFVAHLNDAFLCFEYGEQLIKTLRAQAEAAAMTRLQKEIADGDGSAPQSHQDHIQHDNPDASLRERLLAHQLEKEYSCFEDFLSGARRMKKCVDNAINLLVIELFVSPLEAALQRYVAMGHVVDDDEYHKREMEGNPMGLVLQQIEYSLKPLSEALRRPNYLALVDKVSGSVADALFQVVIQIDFNQLGALQFDSGLRALVSRLGELSSWTVRDRFARVTSSAAVLCADSVEDGLAMVHASSGLGSEAMNSGDGTGGSRWLMTQDDVTLLLKRRVDL